MKYVLYRFVMLVALLVIFPFKTTYWVVRAFCRAIHYVFTVSKGDLDNIANGNKHLTDMPDLWT